MRHLKIALLATALVLSGCATGPTFHVSVDSLARSKPSIKQTYFIIPGNKGVAPDDLQFQEYASQAKRVLDANGFVETNPEDADIAIILLYGIGDPKTHHYTYSLPTYGKTGISSSTTYGSVTGYGNMATYSGTTTYTPSYGITGYVPISGSYTTYYRYADLAAFDWRAYKKDKKQIMLWKTSITSVGSTGDLRRVFPVLMAAGAPYIATDTGQNVSVDMHENSKSVEAVKGVLESAKQELVNYINNHAEP